jgi:hypothetical protein
LTIDAARLRRSVSSSNIPLTGLDQMTISYIIELVEDIPTLSSILQV